MRNFSVLSDIEFEELAAFRRLLGYLGDDCLSLKSPRIGKNTGPADRNTGSMLTIC